MTTAVGQYAALAPLKLRLSITDAADDALLQSMCDQVNQFVETRTGRVLAPLPSATWLLDGWGAVEGGRCLLLPRGVVSLSLVENATFTGGPFGTVPAADWFLRPLPAERQPGWPCTELWMTNIPSPGNSAPAWYPGYGTVRLTGVQGWPAIPDDVALLALDAAVGLWRARSSGGPDSVTVGVDGERTISRLLTTADWATLSKYTWREVSIQ